MNTEERAWQAATAKVRCAVWHETKDACALWTDLIKGDRSRSIEINLRKELLERPRFDRHREGGEGATELMLSCREVDERETSTCGAQRQAVDEDLHRRTADGRGGLSAEDVRACACRGP